MDSAQQLENNFLAWITVASIFLAIGVIIKSYEDYGNYYFVAFFSIGITLLLVTNLDYLKERKNLVDQNVEVFPRLDQLFILITITIIICSVITVVILSNITQLV